MYVVFSIHVDCLPLVTVIEMLEMFWVRKGKLWETWDMLLFMLCKIK